ncbi:PD40 domain-containing protein [Candidatus Sumerlaeota bacterium]|nr:PD40 domain-containing protein [Candidatus Sumerlaeota bacterium]
MKFFAKTLALATVILAQGALVAFAAEDAYFVQDGTLLKHSSEPGKRSPDARLVASKKISAFHGLADGGKPIVSLGSPKIEDGYVVTEGVEIAALNDDGSTERIIASNALRAYPSPSGDRIAILTVDPIGDVLIGENGKTRTLPFANRVTLVSWSPDEESICVTAYPPDWAPYKTNNPEGTQDFLRLLNSDLFLINIATGESRQLTNAPGYDYSGVFSPDGKFIHFISSRSGRGAFYRLTLSDGSVQQLTNLAPGSYDVPVGRSDTFVWAAGSDTLLYEAQQTETTSAIRAIKSDGSSARSFGVGRQPRLLGSGAAFLAEDGSVKEVRF